MGQRLTNNAEGGTHGLGITTGANTGGASGDQLSCTKGATSTFQFSNAHPSHGTMGYFFGNAAGEANYGQLGITGVTAASGALREQLWFDAAPSANDQFIASFRSTSGTAATIALSTARRLKVLSSTGATLFTGSVDVPTIVDTRVEAICTPGTTTTGQLTFAWYLGDSTLAQETWTTSTGNFGTLPIAAARFGRTGAVASAWDFYLDDLAFEYSPVGFIGPVGANVPPNVTVGPTITLAHTGAAQAVALTSSATDDGTIASYAWDVVVRSSGTTTKPTITNASSANASSTVTHPGRYDFTVTVTDTQGGAATGTITVYVTTASPKVSGLASNAGAWTNQGGAASLAAALADASDATFVRSPATPSSEAIVRFWLDPMPVLGGLDLTLRDKLAAVGSGVAKVRLIEGAAIRKEWEPTLPGTSARSVVLSLTPLEASAITSWLDLALELSWA